MRSTLSSATSGLVIRRASDERPALASVSGREERVGHRLGDAEAEQHLAGESTPVLTHAQLAVHHGLGHRLAQTVVAVVASDLLDHVDLVGRVEPPSRQHDIAGVAAAGHRVSDRVEQGRQIVCAQLGAEDAVDGADANRDRPVFDRKTVAAGVDGSGMHHEVRTRLREQLDEASDRQRHPVGVDATLESGRGLGSEVRAGDGLADPDEREPRHLQRDSGGRVADLGVETAHHTADPDRNIVRVADEQVVRREGAVLSVERGEALALVRQTDAESAAAERVEVVGVVGLVEFEHHVVADVDDVADRTHAGRGEALGHPVGRWLHLDAGDHRGREACASIAVDDVDRRRALVAGDGERRGGLAELDMQLRGEIAGDTDVAPTVGTVAGDVGVDQHVERDPEGLAVRTAERRVGRQHTNTRMVVTETEFAGGTEHSLGVDSEDATSLDRHAVRHGGAECCERNDVTLGHVERAAPHVAFLAVAGVDVDALDLGRVGVLFETEHTGGDHARHGLAHRLDRVDLESERGEGVRHAFDVIGVRRVAEVAVFVEP